MAKVIALFPHDENVGKERYDNRNLSMLMWECFQKIRMTPKLGVYDSDAISRSKAEGQRIYFEFMKDP